MEEVSYSPAYFYSAGILLLFTAFIIYFVNKYTYWTQRGIIQERPVPIFGNFADFVFLKRSFADVVTDIYYKYSSAPYVGAYFFNDLMLVVRDPEIIKCVMTKDFNHFHSRGLNIDKRDRFSYNLISSYGDDWKIWRQNLTTIFTSSKMKSMMYLMVECSRRLTSYLESTSLKNKKVDIRKMSSDFTIEVIGSCVFGLQMNSLSEDGNAFRAIGDRIFETSVLKSIKEFMRMFLPSLYYALCFKFVDADVEQFITRLVTDVNNSREGKPAIRHDFVDLLRHMRSRGYIERDTVDSSGEKKIIEVDDIDLASQSFVFFAAGFETSATTLSFALYELAKNRHIQAKLRDEITEELEQTNGEITYELLTRLAYLDMVVDEVLRMYPVGGVILRQCTTDYKMPDSDLVLKEGTRIHIPLKALHSDPQYYDNPEQFNPDNFLPEVKAARHPYVYLPFGEGPRNCVGLRFGKMQVKIALIAILEKHDVFPSEDTPDKITLNKKNFITEPIGGIHLNVVPLKVK